MKKTDLIAHLSNKTPLSKSESKKVVEIILKQLTQAIVSDEGAELRGFGRFYKKYRKNRIGINPKTGERTQVQEKFVPFFKPGKSLKQAVNKG